MDWLGEAKAVLSSRAFATAAGAVVGGVLGGVATGGAGVVPGAVAGASAGGALHGAMSHADEPPAPVEPVASQGPALKVATLENGSLLLFQGDAFVIESQPVDSARIVGDVPRISVGKRSFEPKWQKV